MQIVTTVPAMTARIRLWLKSVNSLTARSLSLRVLTESLSSIRPRKRMPKPRIPCPRFLTNLFLEKNCIAKPMAIAGSAICVI